MAKFNFIEQSLGLFVLFLIVSAILFFRFHYYTVKAVSSNDIQIADEIKSGESAEKKSGPQLPGVENDELFKLKSLYHKLHNLERFSDVLPEARDTLLRLFSESLQAAASESNNNILGIKLYEREAVEGFIDGINNHFCGLWNEYIVRRQSGGGRELFTDRHAAIAWLREQAPAKLVDGAWLGHLQRFSAPYETRGVARNAWQVMSEELGDGDLAKNHAYLYQQLLNDVGVHLPSAEDLDFIHPRHDLTSLGEWRAAVAQLLISLFPHDFLPEILGFNMHFELLTWHTLCATKELRELDINDYYFVLHVSIDNAHSGHTAMATKIVVDYMDSVASSNGPEAAAATWKRVQVGYALSHCVSSVPALPRSNDNVLNVWNPYAEETLRLFQAKSLVSRELHCTSKARIGGRSLIEWMDPESMRSTERAGEFLEALSKSRAWICPGNSQRSRLVQALSWGGRMFGAFSDKELETLRAWIHHLAVITTKREQQTYWEFTKRDPHSLPSLQASAQDILVDYPVFDTSKNETLTRWLIAHNPPAQPLTTVVKCAGNVNLGRLIPLWFVQTALLEGMVAIPIRTCNTRMSAVLRVVRAQRGFQDAGEGCAGMDELRRSDHMGLHEVGQAIVKNQGHQLSKSLQDVFKAYPASPELLNMLHMAMRPLQFEAALVGMASAFASFHQELGHCSDTTFLGPAESQCLGTIAKVELRYLQVWLQEVAAKSSRETWRQGFEIGRQQIEACFGH